MEDKFAEVILVEYKWPEESEYNFGFILYTNIEDDAEACKFCGVSDDTILIYTDTLDPEEIKKNFDGLEIIYD